MAPVPPAAVGFWEQEGKLFEYPPELCIRNTFVDSKSPRCPSLDGFFTERRVQSCPSSGIEKDDESDDNLASFCSSAANSGPTASTSAGSSDGPPWDCSEELASWTVEDDLEDVAPETVQASGPTVLSLGSMLSEDYHVESDSNFNAPGPLSIYRNVGSAMHGSGDCKPCAFFHTKGCGSGDDCKHCHACAPGAKKVMKRERLEVKKGIQMRNSAMYAAAAIGRGIPQLAPVGIFYF